MRPSTDAPLRTHPRPRRDCSARLERLEPRVVLGSFEGNLAMLAVTALSPQSVRAEYRVDGTLPAPVTLGIYRASDSSLDPSSLLVGQASLTAAELTPGTHQVAVPLNQALGINPSLRYVLAAADPGDLVAEADETDNAVAFRTWIVGAVTHGYQPDGRFPSWVRTTADALEAVGYDSAIAFDWAAASALPAPDVVPRAAEALASMIDRAIASFPVRANDVVDVHLIGHSRGGGLVSLAAAALDRSAPPLSGGFLKLTLLDPHPARNGPVAYESSSSGPIGTLTRGALLAFQAATNDPPLAIAPGVDRTEIFYQHAPATQALRPEELFLNLWGEVPAGGAVAGVVYYNLTVAAGSHQGIRDFYLRLIVPLLATGGAVPIPPSPVPAPPTGGGPAQPSRAQGYRYEAQLLRLGGLSASAVTRLLRSFDGLNRALARRRYASAGAQIRRMERSIVTQSGRGIPALAAQYLVGGLELARVLLLPRSAGRPGRSAAGLRRGSG